MDARPAAPAPPPLQASVTWASPSPSLYQFPSYRTCLNENPNPDPLFAPSDGYCSVDYGSFKPVPVPKKGIYSEGFTVRENISNDWPRNYNTSLPGVSGYGYGYPSYYLENSYKISESSAGPVKCTTPYSVSGHTTNFTAPSGHTTNFTTPSKILKASRHVENGIVVRNISQPTIQVPSAVPNPMPSSQQSDTVLMKNSGFQFSSKHIENAKIEKFQKVPNRIGRVRPHPHKSTYSDIHKEEKVQARNAEKEETEAKDNQRAQLEQLEIAKQSMSMDGNAVQHSSSCRPHATSAGFPGDTVGTFGSSVRMAEDAPLDVILEAFRYLSGILSSSNFDASELDDHDRELLQFVMDNRRVFTAKNMKDITNKNFQDSRPKDAQSSIVGLKTDVVIKLNKCPFQDSRPNDAQSSIVGLKTDVITKLNKSSYNMEEKLHSVASKINNDELESADHHNSSDLSIRENVAQTVEKTCQGNFINNEESFHAQVYKKLWIDAEAALCSLKYELQLAKMKIEADNRNHQTEGKLQQLLLGEVNKMRAVHVDMETLLMPKENSPPAALSTPMYMEVADVMARLKVLKDRDDTPNSAGTTEQPKLAVLPDLEVRDATLCPNGSQVGTSTWKSDGEINHGLDASICSTNTEARSCETEPDSGGEASIFSSEWKFELL